MSAFNPPFSFSAPLAAIITDSVITGNASSGVVIDHTTIPSSISNSTVSGNNSGIHVNGSQVMVQDSEISGNAQSGLLMSTTGYHGYNDSQLDVQRSVISGNGLGLSVHDSQARLDVKDTQISHNSVGGLKVSIGGIYAGYTTIQFQNATLSGNDGPGIEVANQDAGFIQSFRVSNSTIIGNHSDGFGGGIQNYYNNPPDLLTLDNTIIAGNTANLGDPDISGEFNMAYSLIGDAGAATINETVFGSNVFGQDPLLGPLKDNGGPTKTHELLAGSPAINKGDPDFTPPPAFDQRGPGFPRVASGRIDIGAFESESAAAAATARLAVLGDINGDNTEDVAVLVHDTSAGTVTATVRDAEDDHLIKLISFNPDRTPVAFEVMADIDGNGAPELVVLGQGSVDVEIRDSLSGVLQTTVAFNPNNAPVDLAVLPDQNGNGTPELAVLARSSVDDAVSVVIKDALTRQPLNYVGFNSFFTPQALAVLADINGNARVELAVLGVDGVPAGVDKVEIRDSATDALVSSVFYGAAIQAKRLTVLADQNNNTAQELVVLRQGTWVEARINDALNGALLNRVGYTPGFVLSQVFTIPDLNGNGVPELGALGINPSTDQVRVQVRDALSDVKISDVYFGKDFQPQDDVAVINDINGNGSAELVYLGRRQSDGKLRVIIRDALTRAVINTVDF